MATVFHSNPTDRNKAKVKTLWQFTVEDARISLNRLYPDIDDADCQLPVDYSGFWEKIEKSAVII
jgi:hypothetical protein